MKTDSKEELLSSIAGTVGEMGDIPEILTVLPLRDVIIFPNMIFPVLIGRSQSLKAVAEAVERNKYMFVAAQKSADIEEPANKDLYKQGTVVKIMQVMRLPNNLLKVLVEGVMPGRIKKFTPKNDCMEAEIDTVELRYKEDDKELKALIKHTSEQFENYVKNSGNLPPDLINAFNNIDDPERKLFYAAANISAEIASKQKILAPLYLKKAYYELSSVLESEIEMLELETEIDSKVNESIQKTQKKFYIQEQIRALQKELGEAGEGGSDIDILEASIKEAKLPKHAQEKAEEELERLRKTPTMSPEFPINRNYLELLTKLPWNNRTQDILDIEVAKNILDTDHYGLEKPKDRILEFISVLSLSGNLKKQILCLAGPPGVGKTSLVKSIARSIGREYIRISLGGMRDEAEIRGHRKTYIGSMPGKIIQSMKKAGTKNPVILLDEIDKMASDFRGDPASALLEVLDPEQNINFNDHYLEIDFDLSEVMFITTANVKYNIPGPLLDRMEVIDISSYLDPDKLQIAKNYILPRLMNEFGLADKGVTVTDSAIMEIVTGYTKEAGVRNLERKLSSLLRKVARELIEGFALIPQSDNILKTTKRKSKKLPSSDAATETEPKHEEQAAKEQKGNSEVKLLRDNAEFIDYVKNEKIVIDSDAVIKYLKNPQFRDKTDSLKPKIGVATGLAWTPTGGDTLPVEVNIMPGSGEKLTLTGKLGDVMKESATAALSYLRANYERYGLDSEFSMKKEIHIHVPEGAIGKDGPSAGITMTMALLSAVSKNPLRGDVAMTGEITLRGNVLPIGGLKEKLLAAKKLGIKTVIIPKDNESDLDEIPASIKNKLEICPIETAEEAVKIVFSE